jgi:16S rRNA (guanine527-N7)-methyltransferase
VTASLRLDAKVLSTAAIRSSSADLGVQLSEQQADRLAAFAALLVKWNRVHNLTALDKPGEIFSHHLLDSLSIVPELLRMEGSRPLRILDVGAGGGLPGLPVAIALPGAHVTLIDRVQKKTAFLQQARTELALGNVDVVHGRVENFSAALFDVIVARALGSLADFTAVTAHLVADEGYWAAMKGTYPTEEISALPATVQLARAVKLHVPLLGAERHLVVLRPHPKHARHL